LIGHTNPKLHAAQRQCRVSQGRRPCLDGNKPAPRFGPMPL
jgi:hypothetical protein